MTTYRTGVTGPFPRTEALVQATRDLDRGRISPEAGEAAFVRAEAEVAAVEERLALDARTGGYLRWPDLLRPFTEIWPEVSAGPLTRFFETNSFYRQPIVRSPPQGGRGRLGRWLPKGPNARAILPGPYTFRRLAEVSYAPDMSNAPVAEIAAAMAAELLSLGPNVPPQVQFQEPMLVYDPPSGESAEVVTAYRLLADALPNSEKLVWTYFGDAGPVLRLLGRLPVEVVGFDLFESTLDHAEKLSGHGIGAGVIDSRSTLA
ncbi:MAG TPA: hypothetical protein VML94_02875, partial [Thermoplasmata archaeon]|nr:hypothetical protein [Thermoplasmata archaeon]